VQPAQPRHATHRLHNAQATHATLPATAKDIAVTILPATAALPAVAIDPATPALAAVAADPATPALAAVAADPATAVLAMVAAEPATALLAAVATDPTTATLPAAASDWTRPSCAPIRSTTPLIVSHAVDICQHKPTLTLSGAMRPARASFRYRTDAPISSRGSDDMTTRGYGLIIRIFAGGAVAVGCCAGAAPPAGADPDPYGGLHCSCRGPTSIGSAETTREIERGLREGLSAIVPGLPVPAGQPRQ
jgi:hypothetical protein